MTSPHHQIIIKTHLKYFTIKNLFKVKIDYINETLDKKYLSLGENESMNNEGALTAAMMAASSSSMPIESLKSKEEIYNYYEQLEENLKQVRGEIDKLKEEAYNDLVYINQILTTGEEEQQQQSPQHPPDIDQVYLKNDEEEKEKEDEEEETQYLSQQADSSQVYMTPAESWQTLQNQNSAAAAAAAVAAAANANLSLHKDEERTLKSSNGGDNENETDLDQDDDADDNEPVVEEEKTLKLSNNHSYRAATNLYQPEIPMKKIGMFLSLNRVETSIICQRIE